jgi:hypothetical protein
MNMPKLLTSLAFATERTFDTRYRPAVVRKAEIEHLAAKAGKRASILFPAISSRRSLAQHHKRKNHAPRDLNCRQMLLAHSRNDNGSSLLD